MSMLVCSQYDIVSDWTHAIVGLGDDMVNNVAIDGRTMSKIGGGFGRTKANKILDDELVLSFCAIDDD